MTKRDFEAMRKRLLDGAWRGDDHWRIARFARREVDRAVRAERRRVQAAALEAASKAREAKIRAVLEGRRPGMSPVGPF